MIMLNLELTKAGEMIIVTGRFVYRTTQFTRHCQRLISTHEVEPKHGDSDDASYLSKSQ